MVIKEEGSKDALGGPVVPPLGSEVDRAIDRTHAYFRRSQYPDGYWWGELESNNSMEAEYLMLTYFLGRVDQEKWRKATNYILSKQREDGSWANENGR